VESGLYAGALNRGFNLIDFLPREIIGDTPGGVVIDLEGQDRFVLENRLASVIGNTAGEAANFTFRLQNLEFRNGLGEWAAGAVGIVVQGSSSGLVAAAAGIIENCRFVNNSIFTFGAVMITETIAGGGAAVLNALSFNITNTTFLDNSAQCINPNTPVFTYNCGGGAIRTNRDDDAPNNFLFTDCLFENNSVNHNVQGGISVGGAISTGAQTSAASNDHYTRLDVIRSRFVSNSVFRLVNTALANDVRGGAISTLSSNLFVNCSSTGNPEDCAFAFNSVTGPTVAAGSVVAGGAVGSEFATIVGAFSFFNTFDTVTFYGNTVNNTGTSPGTGFNTGGGALASVQISASQCTFCNNSVSGEDTRGQHIILLQGAGLTNLFVPGPEEVVFQCPSNNETAIAPPAFICNDPLCVYPTPAVDPMTGICTSCVAPFFTPTPTVVCICYP
jgi:hypothetical protein